MLVLALFAPWYAVDLSGPARDELSSQTGQLPAALGQFTRELLSVLPDRIVGNGWEVFEKTDIVLLCCGLAASFAALLGRFDVAALAGGAAIVTTVAVMVDGPGPGGAIVEMQWGPWAALAGAVALTIGARLSAGAKAPAAPAFDLGAPVAQPPAVVADRPGSVAPPAEF